MLATDPERRNSSEDTKKRKLGQRSDSDISSDHSLPTVHDTDRHQAVVSEVNDAAVNTAATATKPRNGLTREQAVEIYARRPDEMGFQKSRRGTMVGCEAVAVEYGVTPKTVRDIWRGRTWGEATGHPQSDRETRSVPARQPLPAHARRRPSHKHPGQPVASGHLCRRLVPSEATQPACAAGQDGRVPARWPGPSIGATEHCAGAVSPGSTGRGPSRSGRTACDRRGSRKRPAAPSAIAAPSRAAAASTPAAARPSPRRLAHPPPPRLQRPPPAPGPGLAPIVPRGLALAPLPPTPPSTPGRRPRHALLGARRGRRRRPGENRGRAVLSQAT